MKLSELLLFSLTLFLALPAATQQVSSNAAAASTAVPPLIPYSGVVSAVPGAQLAAGASITFLIYKDEQGGEPLFTETQTVAIDATGHYKAQLGATFTNGIPIDLFATGEARWLEVQVAGEAPQPRVLLVSVPYALKAADAATLGGLPPSAFALAHPASEAAAALSPAITPDTATNVTTTGGTSGYLPVFTGASTVVDSILFQSATGIGVGDVPNSTAVFDVNGKSIWRGLLNVSRAGNATTTAGFDSYPIFLQGSVYNSATKASVMPAFQLQVEPTGNDTATPGATFNLLANSTGGAPAETGLYFNTNGTIHFATRQTFPGTGAGTITGVTPGTGLTGGGSTGSVTLNLDTTKVPLLAASNTFTGNQTITGNLTASATVSAGVVNAATLFELGGTLFAFGSIGDESAYLGYAGNFSNTGTQNTGTGFGALQQETTGSSNTANGYAALYSNTTGQSNTASGFDALYFNTIGFDNAASGAQALYSNTTGGSNTASGYQALYSNTTGVANTASGKFALLDNVSGNSNTAAGVGALSENTTGGSNTASGESALPSNTTGISNVGVGTFAGQTLDESSGTGSNNTAVGDGARFGTGTITNATAIGSDAVVSESNTLILGCIVHTNGCQTTVSVGIGTTTPDNLLTVNGTADKPGGGSWGTYSDGRLKTVNGNFGSGLGQVMQLRPIRYRYKPDNAIGIRDADEHIGVVAQEVQRVIPEAVTENGKGYLLVNNDPIIWSMVNAIKEQQREIEQQQKLLRAQSVINEEQGKLLRAQSAAMQSLAAEVRETRKTLREVKAQAASGPLTMVASK